MNKHQRIVLFAAAGLIAGMLLYPPFIFQGYSRYGFFYEPLGWGGAWKLDIPHFFAQAGIVLLIAAPLVLAFKKPSP